MITLPTLHSPRTTHSCVVFRNRYYAFGGAGSLPNEYYDFDLGIWNLVGGQYPEEAPLRKGHHLAVYGGHFFFAGGLPNVGPSFSNSTYQFDPVAETWTKRSDLALVNGRNDHIVLMASVDQIQC